MADSAFWRELAAQFLQIPGGGMLRADGHYTVGSGEAWRWQLAGGAGEFTRDTFETLARRGAFESAPAGTTDLLVAWLEAIRKEHINFRSDQIATEVNGEGRDGLQYVLGTIDRVCEASAILCKKLEARAIQAEFEEKQRNNPRNWSQFRQQYEAFRSMKEIINEPAERIPEEWVRSTIARIQGIKPEDVTLKQIAFEVSGLLSSTKRHIELIPSAPQGSPPAPEAKPSDQAEPKPVPAAPPPEETIAAQIQRLREECKWTIPELAEAAGLDSRTVDRHLAGKFIPYPRTLSAYEKAFRKRLKRQVVIRKMP
jgi:hypothetical protein